MGFPCGSASKKLACNVEPWVFSLGWEDPLEKGKANEGKTPVNSIQMAIKLVKIHTNVLTSKIHK